MKLAHSHRPVPGNSKQRHTLGRSQRANRHILGNDNSCHGRLQRGAEAAEAGAERAEIVALLLQIRVLGFQVLHRNAVRRDHRLDDRRDVQTAECAADGNAHTLDI